MEFTELLGKRIKLIQLDESNLDDMYEYSKNPLLYLYLEIKPHQTFNDTKQYFDKLTHRSSMDTNHHWFISLKDSGKVIGSFGVINIDWRKKIAEIGYGIHPDYWRKGYFKEVLHVVLRYLFFHHQFHRIYATTHSNNLSSIRGLESVGFQKEGVHRDHYLHHDGKRFDAVVLSILHHEYQQ
jgi:[ribosomal protein S5]-alanine N-acetyltransferase